MDKKAKIALAVIKKVYDSFPETQEFIGKTYVEQCWKENTSVDEYFLPLIITVSFFLYYDSLWFAMKYIIFFYIL